MKISEEREEPEVIPFRSWLVRRKKVYFPAYRGWKKKGKDNSNLHCEKNKKKYLEKVVWIESLQP